MECDARQGMVPLVGTRRPAAKGDSETAAESQTRLKARRGEPVRNQRKSTRLGTAWSAYPQMNQARK